MKKETHKITDKNESYAQQLPLSVLYYICNGESKTSKFMCQKDILKSVCLLL
jgi:hypothetical protein